VSSVEALGFRPTDRIVVVHVDDVGMSESANRGALEALGGAATCGSVMVPCPAFRAIARVCAARPGLDLGVHLTLNAEYAGYRWGPVRPDVPGLVSPDGGMWRTTRETVLHASADEVEAELRAQVNRALDAGIDVTHLDAHMGTVFDPKFIAVYATLARDYRLPVFIPRVRRTDLVASGLPPELSLYAGIIEQAEREGFPVFDHFDADSLSFAPGTGEAHNRARLDRLGAGLSYLITHCAHGDAELERITPESWRQRSEEHRIYSDGTMAQALRERGTHTIGMRPLRELLRGRLAHRDAETGPA
jgi:hypothetical protein